MVLPDGQELIKRFAEGDDKAFRIIFNRYYNLIYVFCKKFVHDSQDAQEITIDTLNKLFKKHSDFSSIPAVRSFLYKVCRNQCFDYLSKKERQTKKMNLFLSTYDWQQGTGDDEIDGEMLYQLITDAMEDLPERSRSIIELFYNKGLKYREIATVLNISVKDVERQKAYALKKLQKIISGKYKLIAIFIIQTYLITGSFKDCLNLSNN